MDRHLLVLSLEAVVDKVEEVEVEEVREEVPSLDHTSGARANDLAELCLCVLFVCRISVLDSSQLNSQCTSRCVTSRKFLKGVFSFLSAHQMIVYLFIFMCTHLENIN